MERSQESLIPPAIQEKLNLEGLKRDVIKNLPGTLKPLAYWHP